MDIQATLLQIVIFMPGFLFSLSFHEAAHGYVAYKFGDPTAKNLGRVTVNPIPHTDILGTIILPIFGLMVGFLFGWGKPVPVDYRNLKNFKTDGLWIAAAGPASNLILAFAFAGCIYLFNALAPQFVDRPFSIFQLQIIGSALKQYLYLNLALCFFNLIPVQPLDGGKILYGILPKGIDNKVDEFASRFGMVILLVLIFTGGLRWILWPPIEWFGRLLLPGS